MEVLFHSLTFIAFVFVSGVNTDSYASSYAESKASSHSEAYSSAYASSSATSSTYTNNDNNCKPLESECKKNEKEVSCINSVCEYRNCSDIGKPIKCVRLDPTKCVRGCICENEYLRDDSTGLCIPKDQCPTEKCGVNEIYDICPPTCPPQRCDVDERVIRCAKNPEPGDPACKPGCRCIDNYKKNASGICIPKEECFTCTGQNEVVGCQTSLPQTCESIGENSTAVESAVCTPACLCKPGFYRNKIGDCISKEQCLKCTGPNEYFSCGSACDNVCATLSTQNQTNCPIINIVCNQKCYCDENYARDSNNTCIPIKDCPINTCGLNEIYDNCLPICPPPRCDVDEKTIQCLRNPEPGDPACKSGCRCIDNYKKNESGVCIPKEECPTTPPVICSDDEEYLECANGGCGRWECAQQGQICIDLVEGSCIPGCRCKKPLLRAENGSCVPADQCSPTTTPVICSDDEEYLECANGGCGRWECAQQGQICIDVVEGSCIPGCRCKKPLLRAENGSCVPADQCLPTTPPVICSDDEEYLECANGGCGRWECAQQGQICIDVVEGSCIPGCRCKKPLLRAENGSCVPADQCLPTTPPVICSDDEEYLECANGGCGRWECAQQGQICIDVVEGSCIPGCRCKKPLLRAENGSCVPADQCLPTTPPVICSDDEEYLECANGGCGRWECAQQGQICIDVVEGSCIPGCRCKKPLLRAENGSCVPADQCLQTTPPVICSDDEEYLECANGGCGRWECAQQGQICIDVVEGSCIPGCRCKKPLLRAENGSCVPANQCLLNECGINEIYDICPATCPPPRCDVDEKTILCSPNPQPGDSTCTPGCRCIDNYKKNESGICIPKEECPTTPPVVCRDDEEYLECANGGCGRWECAQQGQICVDLVEGGCIPGCRCKKPLLRAEDGSCVPADQCPLICSGQNEVVGCRTACPETCESIGKNCTIIEAAVCIPDCRCKPGFYRNSNGDCISEKQCSKECGIDEIYDICPPTCPPQRCDVDERVIRCAKNPEPGDPACKPGCRCIDNYKKNASGVCIPKEECPGVVSCGPNEIISSCVNGGCGRWNCSQTGEICIKLQENGCREGCHCIDTYLRADNGTCIPADQCPAATTPPVICRDDEEYLECSNGGCGRWKCAQQGQICIDVVEGGCIPGCRCKKPLLRAEDGSCVTADQCPPICTGQNEVVGCRTACSETCNSIGKNCTIIEPAVCTPACRCSPGFYRNVDYKCVPEDECPTKPIACRSDEDYLECANGGCGRWKCSQPGQICIDLIEGGCIGGCRCKKPLVRAENGSCIPADQCPLVCYGQNEVVGCETACPDSCESIGKNCTIIEPAVCKPSCRCKPGYYRNKISECISKEQCLQCSGPNELYSCGPGCDNVCSKLSKENQTNCLINSYYHCNPMCYCEENYARDNYNTCIPIEECPTNENGIKKFTDGNIEFTENFLKVASKINTGVSAVYSPFSLLFLLAPLGLYSKGDSEQQILKALNLQSKSLIRSTIPFYLDEFNSQKNVTLDLAARVYINIQYELSKAFKRDTKNLIKAAAENLDFSKSEQAAKIINDWVELITNNLIKNLVSPDSLSVNTRLVLVNAIYFKGDWLYPFKEENTEKKNFYVNEKKNVTVNMMNQIGSFKYAEIENPNIQVIELPYVNRNLTFVVCLPKSKDGIEEFIDTLGNPSFSVLDTAIKSLRYKRVDVSIPTMEVTTTTDLGNVLRKLNVTAILEPRNANLNGILEKPEEIFVSSATQKATIIVTETGTKAAAANAIIVGVTAVLEPVEVTKFLADHPYAYFILYNGTPIFCGIYRGPE